jgi:hypothetical protein
MPCSLSRAPIVLAALAALLALAAADASAKKKPPPKKRPPVAAAFTPATLAGTWTGTWKNQTFNTTGTLSLTFAATATSLAITPTLTGNVFGCPAPAPATFTVTKGTGPNTWGPAGFAFSGPTTLGTVTATYAFPAGTIALAGSAVPCAPGLGWKIAGTFTRTALDATVAIVLPDGSPAASVITLTKG